MKKSRVVALAALTAGALLLSACGSNGGSGDADGDKPQLTIVEGVLTVGAMTDAKPNAFLQDGKMAGFDIDLVEAVAEIMDLKVEYKSMEFPALLPAVANNQLDMATSSIAATVERQETVAFADGFLVGGISVITKKGSVITEDPDSTAGIRLGLVQGSIQESYAAIDFPDAEVVRFPDNNAGMSALQTDRIDAFFIDTVVGNDYIAQDDSLHMPLIIWTLDLPAAFVLNKENTALKEELNKALAIVFEDGTWEDSYNKWFVPSLPFPDKLPPYENPTP